jgi:hypothetical protein
MLRVPSGVHGAAIVAAQAAGKTPKVPLKQATDAPHHSGMLSLRGAQVHTSPDVGLKLVRDTRQSGIGTQLLPRRLLFGSRKWHAPKIN